MFKKVVISIFLLAVILLSIAFVAIKALSLGQDTNEFNTKYRSKVAAYLFLREVFGLHFDGDGRSDYLGNKYSKILLEVDAMAGINPNPDVLAKLTAKIQGITNKQTQYIISDTNIPYQKTISDTDIKNIVTAYRNISYTPDTARLYLLFVASSSSDDSLIGSTYEEGAIVLYNKALEDFSNESPATFNNYQLSTILHEFGHQFGLPHNDREGCLMTPQAETNHQPRFNAADVIVDFCDYEKQLIRQNTE